MHLPRIYLKAKLDLLLAVLAAVCIWVMLASSSDPLMPWFRGSPLARAFNQFSTGNQIAFGFSGSVVAALFTYYLLVRLPEYERKGRIKRHLLTSYSSFKEAVVQIFLGTVDGSYDSAKAEHLTEQSAFRSHFKMPYAPGQDRWDAIANKMDDFVLRQLVLEVEVLLGEFQYAIAAIDIRDPEVHVFMKRMSSALYRAKNWSSDYDGIKQVLGFFWQLLAGWDTVTGYRDDEYVVGMISRI